MLTRSNIQIVLVFALLLWESLAPFLPLFGDVSDRLLHGGENVAWSLANRILTSLLFTGAFAWASSFQGGLLDRLFSSQPSWTRSIAAILLFDVWTYLWHWMNHRIPFLWQFHLLHHADGKMDVTTAMKFHVGEIFISNVLRVPLLIIFGVRLEELALYEFLLSGTVLVHHANIGFSSTIEWLTSLLFASPGLHKVHHSILPAEYDSNYGSFFSIWDRLFGTLVVSNNLAGIKFGVQ